MTAKRAVGASGRQGTQSTRPALDALVVLCDFLELLDAEPGRDRPLQRPVPGLEMGLVGRRAGLGMCLLRSDRPAARAVLRRPLDLLLVHAPAPSRSRTN